MSDTMPPRTKNTWAGIDLGLKAAAMALIRGSASAPWTLEWVEVLSFSNSSVEERLDTYRLWLKAQIARTSGELIQGVFAEAPFVGKNVRSALLLGKLEGITWALLRETDWPPLQRIAPTHIKKALTGRGSASKPQLAAWLPHYLSPGTALPTNPHATDAIAIAIAGALSQNSAITRKFTSRAER